MTAGTRRNRTKSTGEYRFFTSPISHRYHVGGREGAPATLLMRITFDALCFVMRCPVSNLMTLFTGLFHICRLQYCGVLHMIR